MMNILDNCICVFNSGWSDLCFLLVFTRISSNKCNHIFRQLKVVQKMRLIGSGPEFRLNFKSGRVGSIHLWVWLGRVKKTGPTSNSVYAKRLLLDRYSVFMYLMASVNERAYTCYRQAKSSHGSTPLPLLFRCVLLITHLRTTTETYREWRHAKPPQSIVTKFCILNCVADI